MLRLEAATRKAGSTLRRRRARAASLGALAIAAALGGCRGERRPVALNLVVLVADTLRADHLSLYGYARPTSPRLEEFAGRHGVVFENARSQAPCTFPSVNSLLTSRSPLRFLTAAPQSHVIPADVPTLASVLRAAGYSTRAISASPIVRATPSNLNPQGGFGAGFEVFDESCFWKSARCVTRAAIRAVSELPEPFLVYAHYMDAHDPYRLPPDIRPRFARRVPSGPNREFLVRGDPSPIAERIYERSLDPGLAPGELEYLIARYDDGIRYWDRFVGRLLDELERRGLADRTVVAIVADHGESFLEHGHVRHCRTLYDVEIRVPMVFLRPGLPARRIASPVVNLDLMPTLLDLAGVEAVPAEMAGRSLRGFLDGRGGAPPDALQRSWWISERAVSDGRFKLVLGTAWGAARFRLYDLESDPGERHDVASRERAALARLRGEAAKWIRDEPSRGRSGEEALLKQLRAVGYLQ